MCLNLYTVLPTIFWIYFGEVNSRLIALRPTIDEVNGVSTLMLFYSVGFVFMYRVLLRNLKHPLLLRNTYTPRSILFSTVLLFIVSSLLSEFAPIVFNIRESVSYADGYIVVSQQSVGVRQILKLLHGISEVTKIIIFIVVMQDFKKYRPYISIYLIYYVLSYNIDSSRSTVIIDLLIIIFSWHVFIRPLKFRVIMTLSIAILLLFIAAGIVRSTGFSNINFNGLGEFDMIFANSVELLRAKQAGDIHIPLTILLNSELFSYIPSQLLWFDKNSLSIWYLDNFHPLLKSQGGGFVFGAISQVVVGMGILEALLRGAFAAIIGISLLNMIRKYSVKWWKLSLYVYMYAHIFSSIRDTQLSQASQIVQVYLPTILVISLISYLLNARSAKLIAPAIK